MDGVLFDTERISCECCFEAARQLELQVPKETVYGCFGLSDCRAFVMNSMESTYPNGTFPYDAYRKKHDELFAKRLEAGPPVMKGVRELLEFLKEHDIRTAVASSTRYERVMSNLTYTGLVDFFDKIITGDMVKRSKPEPDIYLEACRRLDVLPQDAAAVEDSPNGIRSAAAADMVTVMVPDMVAPTPELEELFDLQFDSLLDFKRYLEEQLDA